MSYSSTHIIHNYMKHKRVKQLTIKKNKKEFKTTNSNNQNIIIFSLQSIFRLSPQ